MALIKCSECKRDISETVGNCPHCGFSVKQSIEIKSKNDALAQKNLEDKIHKEKELLQDELELKLKQVDETPCPSVSPLMWSLKEGFLYVIFALVSIAVMYFGWWVGGICVVIIGGLGLIFFLVSILGLFNLGKSTELYKWKINNFSEWKTQEKKRIELQYNKYAENMARYGKREKPNERMPENEVNNIRCPICNSAKINRISNLNRSVSVAAWGLASSKIGKQYECKSCKHKW